jgi:hypothetical protein
MYSRVGLTKIVLACAKFLDGVDSGSYSIILSLRDGSLIFSPFKALRARPPSQTTARLDSRNVRTSQRAVAT